MSDTEENHPNIGTSNTGDSNENSTTTTSIQDNLPELELKAIEDDDKEDIGVNIDDVNIKDIPPIDELRNRDDVKITELLDYVDRYQAKNEIHRVKIHKLKESKRENVKKHRGSVIDLHNRMFRKLIETEAETKTELELAEDEILELNTEIKKYKLQTAAYESSDSDQFQSNQIQELVVQVGALEKELNDTKKRQSDVTKDLRTEKMKQERTNDSHRKSISTLHTNMFKKLLDAEDDFEDKIDKLNDELSHKTRELQMEKMKNEQSDKLRRDSIQTVHNNMLTKLLDAQAEHDEKEEKFQNEIKELKAQLRKEILKDLAQKDKHKEKYGDDSDNDSDMSDLETQNETRKRKEKEKKNNEKKKNKPKQFDDLWDEADEPEAEIDRLKAHIEKIERELKEEKEKNVFIEKQRKDSIHNLHNNMFQKLLDAEFEYEEEIERLHKEKEELVEKINFYEESFDKMNTGNGNDINPTQIINLKEEIKTKDEIIEENKQKIFELTRKIETLELKVENEQKQRRGSVSFLSRQMMAKLLEAEEENEEQKADFKLKLLKLEKELEDSKENAFNLEKTRRNSVTKVSQTMFHKLLVAEQTKKQIKVTYEEKIKELEEKLAIERLKTETTHSEKEMNSMELKKYKLESEQLKQQVSQIKNKSETKEKQRRESFTQLQNSYWTKLLQAEDDSAQQIKKLKHEIINLQNQITNRKKTIEWLTTSKLNLITECNRQMNDLRAAVTVYNKNENNNSWF